jgi:hypothetical protein
MMRPTTSTVNRHPADRLADVRRTIAELESEEAKLRAYLRAHPDDCAGDEFAASVVLQNRRRIDTLALADELGAEVVKRFTITRVVPAVYLRRRLGRLEERVGLSAAILD